MSEFQLKNISFKYGDSDKLILSNLNVEVENGEFVSLLGQSGCGKSTLLRLLSGLELPTSGEVIINGVTNAGPSLDKVVVFQDYGLFPWMSAGENITIALEQKFKDKNKKELRDIAEEWLSKVGLPDGTFDALPKSLSGGMKQRCAIARAFSLNSKILLMDEPFGALDAVTRANLQDMVLDLWKKDEEKKTVFFVTHDVDEALLLSNRILVLGQTPSSVIFDTKIEDKSKYDRDSIFDNVDAMKLRAQLIKTINQDVSHRIKK
jgi:NitT/TauT family transport system ATP-binding protein